MAHIEDGTLVFSDYPATAQDEYNNGRLDANIFPAYAVAEVARIDALDAPSFAERHWARGARTVLKDA
jgi:hypothetical protein